MTSDRTGETDGTPTPSVGISAPSELAAALADRYEIERELGRGGMATVYLARDLRHDRPVALKVLLPELALALGPERFTREIKLAARLQHPHILTVHDSGEAAGQLWFTMPFVDGESLRDRLTRERQLPVELALRITTDAARALAYAHEHGVIHRDIKPENLLLTRDGSTLVADFGIARALGGAGEQLTQTGMSVGTPTYMSPEQAAGDRGLDARTDVYSLGTVLYEMLAGEPPFTGATAQIVIAKRFSGEVPRVRQVRPSVPESVAQAVTRALAPVAADRFATAAEFARALEAGTTGERTTETAPTVLTPISVLTSSAATLNGKRRGLRLGLAVLLALVIGAGGFFAWQRSRTAAISATAPVDSVTRLAVLPFENLGRPEDAYFADGMTDEIRGKLATIPRLEVIARASSNDYRASRKTQPTIAKELGVRYLLTGTVRSDPRAGGLPTRIRVHPELVDVTAGAAPTSRWQEPFQAEMADVFQVQADIAGQVAQALDLVLGDSAKRKLDERPTRNLKAYDLYLQANNQAHLRRAIPLYEAALALDSGFVLAWADLSDARLTLYVNYSDHSGVPAAAVRTAAERAVALAPESPGARRAVGYYYLDLEHDLRRAAQEFAQGLQISPNDASLLHGAADAEQGLGHSEDALAHARRADLLDPRSTGGVAGRLALWLRRYPEARAIYRHGLGLYPNSFQLRQELAMVSLAEGDLIGAQQVFSALPDTIPPAEFAAWVASYWDIGWALDDAGQRRVLGSSPADFGDDRLLRSLALAQLHALRGHRDLARAYADTARLAAETVLRATPDDAQLHSLYGIALARLGQRAAAEREGQRAVALMPVSKDAREGAYLQHELATIYTLLGNNEKALDQLESLLKIPYFLSPGWLRIDPTFAPLRGDPRFERLTQGTG